MLVLDPAGEVLLIRFVIPRPGGEFVFWAAPGGEIEPGETPMQAAVRELQEELGLTLEVEGPIRIQENVFEHEGELRANTDYFFKADCEREKPRLIGLTESEIAIMKELRWWSAPQLEVAEERVFPEDLHDWLNAIAAAKRPG
ncbi:NUDIX domain-containing protein [Granulicella rosea]|uniref:NUDIX domain-containing protein n=1 Tax=Granulicella rosea TaxID=474952 RepID=A0A239E2S3_9BACT|nr:NUDIX domain-containing protein [Granulicella rosea]